MKKIISISLAAALSLSSISAQAGFLSTFFANVASDSLQGKGGRYSSDPLIKEKKIQGALAVMGHYKGELDGDFDTFDSRVGIKKFQKSYGLDETGFLSDEEKSQLTYLSNLYTELQKKGVDKSKRVAIYDEIDEAQNSMTKESLLSGFFSSAKNKLRIISEHEDADVYIDGKKVGLIQLGYYTQIIDDGKYNIKTSKKEEFYDYSSEGDVEVNQPVTIFEASEKKEYNENARNLAKKMGVTALPNEKIYIDWNNKVAFQNTSDLLSRRMNFQQANEYCSNLSISGAGDFVLPEDNGVIYGLVSYTRDNNDNQSKKINTLLKKGYMWTTRIEHDGRVNTNSYDHGRKYHVAMDKKKSESIFAICRVKGNS